MPIFRGEIRKHNVKLAKTILALALIWFGIQVILLFVIKIRLPYIEFLNGIILLALFVYGSTLNPLQ